jgi:hypothetical protein
LDAVVSVYCSVGPFDGFEIDPNKLIDVCEKLLKERITG